MHHRSLPTRKSKNVNIGRKNFGGSASASQVMVHIQCSAGSILG